MNKEYLIYLNTNQLTSAAKNYLPKIFLLFYSHNIITLLHTVR
jgi:hypothetical protein